MKPPTILYSSLAAMLCGAAEPVFADSASTPTTSVYANDIASDQFVAGIVTAKTETTLTVKQAVGEPVVVALTDKTKYYKSTDEVKLSDMAVGSTVFVSLKKNGDGKTEAERVSLTKPPKPAE